MKATRATTIKMEPEKTSTSQPERVAIYARVSTDEQRERRTIQAQLHRAREYAERQEWEVVAEFPDEGVSGSVPFEDRPAGRRLLDVAGDGLFSRVVVLCVDRLSRDVVDAALVRKELDKRGTPLEFVLQSFDGTPEGELQFNIFASFAQYERRLIGRRTNDGKKRRVRSGKYLCVVAPFGHFYDQERGVLEPNPTTAPILKQMFAWARDGVGLRAIANKLDAKHIPPPSPKHPKRQSKHGWHFTTVYKILTHRRYLGEATYSGEPMTCPALIDHRTFDAVQQAMKERKRHSKRNTRHFYLLQQLVRCRHCGSGCAATTTRTGLRVFMCYAAMRYGIVKSGHEGVRWRWRMDELEPLVKEAARGILLDPERQLARATVEVDAFKAELSAERDRLAFLTKRLDELDQEERRVLAWARKGLVDDTQLASQLQEIRSERWTVQAQVEELKKVADQADMLAEAADWFRDLYAALPPAQQFTDERTGEPCEPTDEQWRALIGNVVTTVWAEGDGSVTLEGPLSLGGVPQKGTSVLKPSR